MIWRTVNGQNFRRFFENGEDRINERLFRCGDLELCLWPRISMVPTSIAACRCLLTMLDQEPIPLFRVGRYHFFTGDLSQCGLALAVVALQLRVGGRHHAAEAASNPLELGIRRLPAGRPVHHDRVDGRILFCRLVKRRWSLGVGSCVTWCILIRRADPAAAP